jgi:hypothetical protein
MGTRMRLTSVPFIVLLVLFLTSSWAGTLKNVEAQAWRFEVTSVVLRDVNGNEKSSFARGEFIIVEIKVTNIVIPYYYYYYNYYYEYGAESFLVLARITTMDNVMWGIGAFSSSLLPGESIKAAPGIAIPVNAPAGTYKVTVFVWSNWASLGGYPVAESREVTFTVT